MMNNEIKLPASFAEIDENEMMYLDGGDSITQSQGYITFSNIGVLFNYIARVFSSAGSIVTNVCTIIKAVEYLNNDFSFTGKKN